MNENERTGKSTLPAAVYFLAIIAVVMALCAGIFAIAMSRRQQQEPPPVEQEPVTATPERKKDPQTPVLLEEDVQTQLPAAAESAEPLEEAALITEPEQAEAAELPEEPLLLRAPLDGPVAKAFSDTIPVYSVTMNDYRTHSGIDLDAEPGSAVYPCAKGVIVSIHEEPFMGCCVTIDHGNGLVSRYKNLSSARPEGLTEGMTVDCDTVIGAVGDTALSEIASESHLHFELAEDGVPVDPCAYMDFPALTPDE